MKTTFIILISVFYFTFLSAQTILNEQPGIYTDTIESKECETDKDGNFYPLWESDVNRLFNYCPHQNFKVGINTNNPLLELHVNGSGYITKKLGIGINEPREELDVSGTIQSSNNGRQLKLSADPINNYNLIRSTNEQSGNIPLKFQGGNNDDWLTINSDGNIGINTSSPTKKLEISNGALFLSGNNGSDGNARFIIEGNENTDFIHFYTDGNNLLRIGSDGRIYARSIEVTDNILFPDYVFNEDYNLMSLKKLEEYIIVKKHLPNIPTADEIEENGMDLGDMNILLLEKVEELTLYVIQLNNKLEEQQKIINKLTIK